MEVKKEGMLAALDKAVSDTFEQMAFMEVCPVAGDAVGGEAGFTPDVQGEPSTISATPDLRWVRIELGHPLGVELRMGCPVELLAEVSETVFGGMDFPDGMDVHGDTLAELANMIAGAFLGKLFPKDSEVMVGLPKIESTGVATLGETETFSEPMECFLRRYSFDDGRYVIIQIKQMLICPGS